VANKTFWTPENRRRLDAMVRKGTLLVSLEKAAEILGTSFSTVHAEIMRRGVKPAGHDAFEWTIERLKMLRAMVDEQGNLILPRANAAKIIGCGRSTLVTGLIKVRGGAKRQVDPPKLKALVADDRQPRVGRHEAARPLSGTGKTLRPPMRVAGARGAPRFRWTSERIAQLQSLTKGGRLTVPHAEAALQLGCSLRALQAYLSENRTGTRIPPTRKKRVDQPSAVGALLTIMRAWLPNLAPFQVAAALAAEPRLDGQSAAQLAIRLRKLATIYHASEPDALRMALSAPGLFRAEPAVLRRNLRASAHALGMDAKDYVHAVRKKPALASQDIQRHFADLPSLLDLSAESAKRLFLRYPHLLIETPKQLRGRMKALAKALDLPTASIIAAVRRQPNILRMSIQLQVKHCADVARILDVDFQAVAAAYIQNPSLLQVKPETIRNNIAASSRLLGCERRVVAAAFLRKPPLLTMRPAFIAAKAHKLARIFKLSRHEMTERVLSYPYLLSFSVENTTAKARLLRNLAEALGTPATTAEILSMCPMALSYAKERIAKRVEMAREGIGRATIGAMLSMSDSKADSLRSSTKPGRRT
jgi:hypothetical protein